MKTLEERVAERVAGFQVEAMSNLRSKSTGVSGAVIWISAGEFSGKDAQHGPRIKVVLGDRVTRDALYGSVSVRVTRPPEVLGTLPPQVRKDVVAFIEKNYDVLLQHWAGDLDTVETLAALQKV